MIFCSNGRMKQKGLPDVKLWSDESMKDTKYLTMELEPGSLRNKCYAVDYDLGNIGTRTMAFCRRSADHYCIRVRSGAPMTHPPCIYNLIFFVDFNLYTSFPHLKICARISD
jgi:hypothetical protein